MEGIRRCSRGTQNCFLISCANLTAYFAILKRDPLYLFTRNSLEDYMTEILEEAWMPLLVYIQEFYSYPIRLNGFRTMSLTSNIPKTDIVFKAKNFVYGQPQSHDIAASRAFQSLVAITPIPNDIKNGFTTTLTVHVPKVRNHPFWLVSSTQSKDKLFGCEKLQDTLTFKVTRWGPLPHVSNFYVTQRAMDIIRNIRAAVSNPIHLSNLPTDITQSLRRPNPLHDCPVFRLGVQLNSMWKCAKLAFSTVFEAQTVELFSNHIQNMVFDQIL